MRVCVCMHVWINRSTLRAPVVLEYSVYLLYYTTTPHITQYMRPCVGIYVMQMFGKLNSYSEIPHGQAHAFARHSPYDL